MKDKQILSDLGNRVRKLRKEKGWSQEEAAHQFGLARTYYGDIERGSRNVSLLNLEVIANGLGISVRDLF